MSDIPDDDDRTVIRPAARPTPPPQEPDDDRTRFGAPQPAAPATAPPSPPASVPLPPPVRVAAPAAPASAPGGPGNDHENALPIGTVLYEFKLTGVLGEGGFGIVYLAQDTSLNRRVALKEYMPSALAARRGGATVSVKSERHRETFDAGLKSFINEARLLAQFDHPSLVKVYRFWEANGTAYMVMPFYEGITLKDRLRELGAPPDETWLRALLSPLTEALQVIHRENCYHRDIAPDNVILLAGSGKPLLLDFGAARQVLGDMTQALTVILKPGYAPLEQYAEVPGMKQGPWTDVYALAAVIYAAIQGRTPPVSVARLMSDSYVPLASAAAGRYSPDFLQAVDRALRVKPDERTPSIEAFRNELGLTSAIAADDARTVFPPAASRVPAVAPAAAGAATGGSVGTAPASRTGLYIGIGAAVLVLGAVGAFYALTPKQVAAPPPTPPVAVAQPAAAPAVPPPAATPAAVAAPAVPASAPAAFSTQAEFDRIVAAQTEGFKLEVATHKSQLQIGKDRLDFTVSSARDGYVYVLVKGPDDSLTLLLPNANAPKLRIAAGQKLRLPPPSSPLETSEPAGREDFLVIVSSSARDFNLPGAKRADAFLSLPTGEAAAALAADFSGRGSVLAGKPINCQTEACAAFGAIHFWIDVTP